MSATNNQPIARPITVKTIQEDWKPDSPAHCAVTPGSALETLRQHNRWRRGEAVEMPDGTALGLAIEAAIIALAQIKPMRARLEAIAAQIEDSQYFGKISPRGAPKMLTEIADSCRVCLDTCDNLARRASLPNTKITHGPEAKP